jgi:hypothetical protein
MALAEHFGYEVAADEATGTANYNFFYYSADSAGESGRKQFVSVGMGRETR